MRKAAFLGRFYESESKKLDEQIKLCFQNGPRSFPNRSILKDVSGIIVPSFNYNISGEIAALAYKELAESKVPEIYILLGGCEGSKIYMSFEDFESPFGVISNAKIYLMNNNVVVDEKLHATSREIEMQIPFLQYILKNNTEKIKIMPILVGNKCSKETILEVSDFIKKINKNYSVIVSFNMIKYGEKFGKLPFVYHIYGEVYSANTKILQFIENFDIDRLMKINNRLELEEMNALCLALGIVRADRAHVLKYEDSTSKTGKENFVTYCSIILS